MSNAEVPTPTSAAVKKVRQVKQSIFTTTCIGLDDSRTLHKLFVALEIKTVEDALAVGAGCCRKPTEGTILLEDLIAYMHALQDLAIKCQVPDTHEAVEAYIARGDLSATMDRDLWIRIIFALHEAERTTRKQLTELQETIARDQLRAEAEAEANAQQKERGVSFEKPPAAGVDSDQAIYAKALADFRLQNQNLEGPVYALPDREMTVAISKAISHAPHLAPKLSELSDVFKAAAADPFGFKNRGLIGEVFTSALEAMGYAFCGSLESPGLSHLKGTPSWDDVMAIVPGTDRRVMIGAKQLAWVGLSSALTKSISQPDKTCTTQQAIDLCDATWDKLRMLAAKETLTTVCSSLMPALGGYLELPPKREAPNAKKEKTSGGTQASTSHGKRTWPRRSSDSRHRSRSRSRSSSGGRGRGRGRSRSLSSEVRRSHRPWKQRGSSSRHHERRSRSRSRDGHSSRRRSTPSPRRRSKSPRRRSPPRHRDRSPPRKRSRSKSSDGDRRSSGKHKASDKMAEQCSKYGGSKDSKYPCFAEMRKPGSCTSRKCRYSHHPKVLEEGKEKEEEKKKKEKKSKKAKKEKESDSSDDE